MSLTTINMSNCADMLQDKIRGSLIGGAIGDALGYPVEFVGYSGIVNTYGEKGITRFDLEPYWLDKCEHTGKAIVSDDTQMTLFTANGILNAQGKGIPLLEGIQQAYLEWLFTQTGIDTNQPHECWLTEIPELNVRRAPGNTCITSLTGIAHGYDPVNHSKGCGGVMRIAPIPLYAAAGNRMDIVEADKLAGDAARITHHHPLGYIPAAILSHVIYRLMQDENPTRVAFEAYVREGMEEAKRLYSHSKTSLKLMENLIEKAFAFSMNEHNDADNITEIGGGWVAEETLAIAIYCAHRYFDNFENAIIASVNHGGDSDSTGAVTGNIIGTIVGYDGIPHFYKNDLELFEVIMRIADELTPSNEDVFIINLTIDGTPYEEVEINVTNPNKTIREQVDSIIKVFNLPKTDSCGAPIQYLLGLMIDDEEEPEILEFEDEDGHGQSVLDYGIKSGDCLRLLAVPTYACPVPVEMEQEFGNDDFVINLTIDGTGYEDIEVKVSNPNKTIRDQISSIIHVFELPEKDNGGNCIQYMLGQVLADSDEPEVLEFEDEVGHECSLLDYNIRSGDYLHLLSVPIAGYACPVPVKMEREWMQFYLRNK